jgi:hypothetical protein
MKLNEQEMFGRIEIALKVYYQQMGTSDKNQIEPFVNWLYNQYGIVRKGSTNEKLDSV